MYYFIICNFELRAIFSDRVVLKMSIKEQRRTRWYFGGLASAGAACFTHPLDLIKVHLQTQQEKTLGFAQIAMKIIKTEGTIIYGFSINEHILFAK